MWSNGLGYRCVLCRQVSDFVQMELDKFGVIASLSWERLGQVFSLNLDTYSALVEL